MNLNIRTLFLVIFFIFFTGCSTKKSEVVVHKNDKPLWLKNALNLPPSLAIGAANVNFNGMYMQQQNAINSARNELSHTIKTTIHSEYKKNMQSQNGVASSHSEQTIEDISNTFMSNSYQLDAYIDKDRKLYVLLYSPELEHTFTYSPISLRPLNTQVYNNKALLNSRCYAKEVLKSVDTKSNLFQNRPEWFFRPNMKGYIGSVGIAEKIASQSFEIQKKRALIQAKTSLSKRSNSKIESKYNLFSMIKHNTSGKLFETSSVNRSANNINNYLLKDMWIDPNNCELFVWIVQK